MSQHMYPNNTGPFADSSEGTSTFSGKIGRRQTRLFILVLRQISRHTINLFGN